MANATEFKEGSFDKLLELDIWGAIIDTWSNTCGAGQSNICLNFTFGAIPLLLVSMVYVRFKKIAPSLFTGLLSTYLLHAFKLLPSGTATILYFLFGFGLALVISYNLFNRN